MTDLVAKNTVLSEHDVPVRDITGHFLHEQSRKLNREGRVQGSDSESDVVVPLRPMDKWSGLDTGRGNNLQRLGKGSIGEQKGT